MDMLDRSHLVHLLQINRAHLRTLEVQNATFGLHAPSHLAIQIAEYRQQIATLETQLSQLLPLHNLPPRDYGSFIGRQAETDQIQQLLLPYPRSRHHVVTIDGIGGIGKSALALEAAYRYCDAYASLPAAERFEAIVWVSAKRTHLTAQGVLEQRQTFRSLTDLFVAVADVLQHPAINLARAEDQLSVVERVLTQQRTLLILDNLETVDDEELLLFVRMAPDPTKVIVTTRHRIDVAYPVRLSGMPQADAFRLIEQEAQRKQVALPSTLPAELWQRTGGLPLAIVWSIGLMGLGGSAESVLRRLNQGQSDIARFCFAASVAHIRQHDAHRLLMALALFATDASREALGVVAGLADDPFGRDLGLEALLRLSLVNKEGDRFSLLPLTREYALAEAAGYAEWMQGARSRWEQYFYTLVETCGGWSRDWSGHDRVERNLDTIQAVLNSLIAGVHYIEGHDGSRTVAPDSLAQARRILEFIPWIVRTCRIRGYWGECERLCATAIELTKALNTLDYLGSRFYDLCRICYHRGDFPAAKHWAQEARDVWRQGQHIKGVCNAERILGLIELHSGDSDEARRLITGALASYESSGGQNNLAHYLGSMGELAEHHGDLVAAKDWYARAVEEFRAKNNIIYLASDLLNLGRVSLALGEPATARRCFNDGLQVARECGRVDMIATSYASLARLDYGQRELSTARANIRHALDLFQRLGMDRDARQAESLLGTIGVALAGEDQQAAHLE